MRAGAAMPAGFRDAILHDFEHACSQDTSMADDSGKLFLAQRICEELRRYDIRGGRAFKLKLELPDYTVANGSRYHWLGPNPESFTEWERICSRTGLPTVERNRLWKMPKHWDGRTDVCIPMPVVGADPRGLPALFDAKRKLAVGMALDQRPNADSPLRKLPVDLLEQVCNHLHCNWELNNAWTESDAKMVKEHCDAFNHDAFSCTTSLKLDENTTMPSAASVLKTEANVAFCEKRDYVTAANIYAQALGAIVPADDLALRLTLHSNLAEACLRTRKWKTAVHHAQEALKLDPAHEKSMRRLAAARDGQASTCNLNSDSDASG